MHLIQVAEIERSALTEYKDNPKLAIDKPQLLKQVKQGAGVIGDDFDRPLNVINIGQIQAFVRANHEQKIKTPAIIEPETKLIEE